MGPTTHISAQTEASSEIQIDPDGQLAAADAPDGNLAQASVIRGTVDGDPADGSHTRQSSARDGT